MEFIEAKRKSDACIYCLSFPNGKCYVGKTKDLGSRMGLYKRFNGGNNKYLQGQIDEFGLDAIDVSILTAVKCKNDVDLDICLSLLEIKYIRELGTLYPDGLNVSLGGEVLGIPIEDITTDAEIIKSRQKGEKAILVYDLEGKFVEEHSSISRFSYDKGVDEENVRGWIGKMKPYKDKWYLRFKRYDYAPLRIEVPLYEVRERVKYRDVIEERIVERERVVVKPNFVLIYDMNGDFVGEYSSNAEAARQLISKSSFPYGKYTQGYIAFKKEGDDYPKKIEDYLSFTGKVMREHYVPSAELADQPKLSNEHLAMLSARKPHVNLNLADPIDQFKLNGEFVCRHNSIRDASLATGIRYSQIYACVKGTTRKAAGFYWKKAENTK